VIAAPPFDDGINHVNFNVDVVTADAVTDRGADADVVNVVKVFITWLLAPIALTADTRTWYVVPGANPLSVNPNRLEAVCGTVVHATPLREVSTL
jgi:hypothetical protein